MDLEMIANDVVFSIINDPEDPSMALSKAIRWYTLDFGQAEALTYLVHKKLETI